MLRRTCAVNVLLVAGCRAAEPPPVAAGAPRAWPFVSSRALAPHAPDARLPVPARPSAPRATFAGEASPVRALLGTLSGAAPDPGRGGALAAAIEALPPERRALGLQGLTPADLWGPDGEGNGLCEWPVLSTDDVSLVVDGTVWMTSPVRDLVGWPQACVDALLVGAGDLSADACLPEDEATFFPEGSACRACLEVDGDVARCEAESACPETATRRLYGPDGEGGADWVSVLSTTFLACAPDLELPGLVLVPGLGEADALPRPFEHGRVSAVCFELWDDGGGEATTLYCNTAAAGGHALADVVAARVADGPHADRVAMAASVATTSGRIWDAQFVYEATLGAVSMPLEAGGWGIEPWKERPGGGSYARELLAGWTLKLTTTRDGVPVQPIDHNRCADWSAPDASGAATCREMGPWTFTWLDDGPVAWFDAAAGDIYAFPLLTLASTGLPDPSIPGGVVMDVRGSTTLADLEGCAWPDAFPPDRIRLYDSAPATSPTPYASFDGQTFRFDRDPDVVLALATNQRRGFCPGR